MAPKHKRRVMSEVEVVANKFTNWVGSPSSIIIHTILFAVAFMFVGFGVELNTVLLVLTTAVSLEAIYLALFIQMTVNRNTQSLADVEEDLEDIQEDVEGIEKDIDEIQEDIDEMEKDIDRWDEEDLQDSLHDEATIRSLDQLQKNISQVMLDIQALKQQKKE